MENFQNSEKGNSGVFHERRGAIGAGWDCRQKLKERGMTGKGKESEEKMGKGKKIEKLVDLKETKEIESENNFV